MISEKEVAKLVEESQQNNKESLNKLFDVFKPFRYNLASKYVDKGVDYDDICQQVDMFFVMSVLDYDSNLCDSPVLHITSKTRRMISDYYRRELLYQKRFSFYGLSYNIEGQLVYEQDNNWILYEEVEDFTELERDVFDLYVKCDLTQAEVAEILGYSREWIRDIFAKIKEKLKK